MKKTEIMKKDKKYRLKVDVPMTGHFPIVIRKGYEIQLDERLMVYLGAGGWVWAKELVESHPEFFEEVKEPEPEVKRDWEVINYDNSSVTKNSLEKGTYEGLDENGMLARGYKIKSVKRLSDGEVFSIGDEVSWDLNQLPGNSNIPFKITSFQVNEIITPHRMFCNNKNIDICYLLKTPTEKEQPFQWTDELACAWAAYLEEVLKVRSIYDIPDILKNWKIKKQQPKEESKDCDIVVHADYPQWILNKWPGDRHSEEDLRKAFEAGGSEGNVGVIRHNRTISDRWSFRTFDEYLKSIKP